MELHRFGLVSCVCIVALCVACSGTSSGGTTSDGGGDSGAESGACRTNVDHRASGTCDSHADAGPMETGCGGTFVPHDDCVIDDDCVGPHPATYVCACQAPRGMGCGAGVVAGNACVPGNCHVDSDCVPCGECRVEQQCGIVTGYYCATTADDCSSNADCGAGFCSFHNGKFTCVNTVACAG